jgi:hypothetical protein
MEDLVPTEFLLSQNYPNPFRNRTIIKYCVPERMKIRLEVFNSRGIKIKTIIDEIQEAGTYKTEFHTYSAAGRLEGGEYIYKLESRDYFETKKMVVLK